MKNKNADSNTYLSFSYDEESVSFLTLTYNILPFIKIILNKHKYDLIILHFRKYTWTNMKWHNTMLNTYNF